MVERVDGLSPLNYAGQPSVVHLKAGENHRRPSMQCSLFFGLSPSDCAGICASARVKEFMRGEMLYVEGDSVQQILLLTSGVVKVTQLGPSGTEVILRLGVTGDVLGTTSLLSTGRHYTTARAFRLCRALVWDAPSFRALVEPRPALCQNMFRMIGADLLELEERFREVATERVGSRVARQLVRLMEKVGRPVDSAVEVRVSREDLAQMTGTTLFTVSRLFSAWEELGVVKPLREAVMIYDVQALRRISD